MEQTLFILLLSLTVLFVVTQIVLFIFFIRSFGEFKKSHNPDEEALKKFKQKSEEILRGSIQKANQILADAQKKGVDILAKEESVGQDLSEDYAKHLNAVEAAFKEQFSKSADDAEKSYNEFIVQVGHVVNERIDKNEEMLKDRAGQMIEDARKALDGIAEKTREQVAAEVDKELDSARSEISEYKFRRMKIIDERIIQMLEDIIKVTLEKKLSLQEQSELVYRALDEAKKENAFR
jgi:uncharacterized protein YjbJ (UPF0337 family)